MLENIHASAACTMAVISLMRLEAEQVQMREEKSSMHGDTYNSIEKMLQLERKPRQS